METQFNWLPLLASLAAGMFVALLLSGVGPVWDWIAQRRIADLSPRLRELNIPTERLPYYLKVWGLTMLGAFVVLGIILQMLPIAIAAVVLLYGAPRLIINQLLARRQTLLRDQMVRACAALANTTRAGLSLGQGLAALSVEIPDPLGLELKRLVHEFRGGRPLAEAIDDVKIRLRLDSFTLFANAVLISLERGGRVTDALENISVSLQENQRLERKIEADTASGRRVVATLTVFPFAFLGLFYFLDPQGTSLIFNHIAGQLVLVTVVALVYVSVIWSRKILAIEV